MRGLNKLKNLILKNKTFLILFSLTIFFYLLSLVIVKNDNDFSERWTAFFLWILSISIFPFHIIIKKAFSIKKLPVLSVAILKEHVVPVAIIAFLAITFSFAFLQSYPFVSIYDQVREGGLNAQEILNGSIKNIFGYGRYEAQGLIHPTIISFFYQIFGPSVLAFRFPAAIVSILDILLIYFLIFKSVNKKAAFWSALILIVIPLHLYYGRTESLVIFTSFFTSVILFLFIFFLKQKSFKIYSLLGLCLGFFSGFYASIRAFAVIMIIIVVISTIREVCVKKINKNILIGLCFFAIFFFVGFGPRIFYTTPGIFFQSTRLFTYNDGQKSLSGAFSDINIGKLSNDYAKSLLVYFKEPVFSTHYPDYQPILNKFFAFFFLLGFISALLFSKNIFLRYICFFALAIPFTNSAITGYPNLDHRLAPLFSVTAILTGYGIYFLFSKIEKLKYKILPKVIFLAKIIIFFYIIYQGINFFNQESATKNYTYSDFLSMRVLYFINQNYSNNDTRGLCMFVSPSMYAYFNKDRLGFEEQYQYFFPDKYIKISANNAIKNNQIYISRTCNNNFTENNFVLHRYCDKYVKFVCSKQGNIEILEESLPNKENMGEYFYGLTKDSKEYFLIKPTATFIP